MKIKFSELSKKLQNQPAIPLPAELCGLLQQKKVIAKDKHKFKVNGVPKIITLDESVIKTGPNRWHVVGKVIGVGTFGTVHTSSLKITVRDGKAWLEPADDVIKSISLGLEADKIFREITTEANFQKRHRIAMHAVVREGNQAYIVTENCGVTLAEILSKPNLDFDTRIQLLLAVANELLLLEQTGVVHRDLKPNNICIKKTPKGFRATVIDFGLAQPSARPDYEDWGTLGYISPETFSKKASTHASDRWAFAGIAGEILNCENADLFKDALSVDGPYRYDTLLKNINVPPDVDPVLIKDLKSLLANQSSMDPKKRDPLAVVIKFLLLIPTRRAMYQKFTQDCQKLENELQKLQKESHSLKIMDEAISVETILKGRVNLEHPNSFIRYHLDKFKNDVVVGMKELKTFGSHLSETKRLLQQTLTAQEYTPGFPNLSSITKKVSTFTEYLKTVNQHTPKLTESLNLQRFANSNSSGVQQIRAIVESNKTSLEKLMLLKEVGQAKTKSNFSNWYSRSHFFGVGRHSHMETLYRKLADLSPEPDKLAGQLNELEEYTKLYNFANVENSK